MSLILDKLFKFSNKECTKMDNAKINRLIRKLKEIDDQELTE